MLQSLDATAMVLLYLVPLPNRAIVPGVARPVLFVELFQSLDYCDNILVHKRGLFIVIDATYNICDSTTNIPALAPICYLVVAFAVGVGVKCEKLGVNLLVV